jgi:DNA-binding CsgD family transcriptional regulator
MGRIRTCPEHAGMNDFPPLGTPDESFLSRALAAWGLTPRELRVLREVVTGVQNKVVAEHLRCAEGTVESHMSSLLQKSRSNTRAMLVTQFWTLIVQDLLTSMQTRRDYRSCACHQGCQGDLPPPMKVVFLDFDGVLNSVEFMQRDPGPFDRLDPVAVARLDTLVRRSGARVVVSSTWRLQHSVQDLHRRLAELGFTGEVAGVTPELRAAVVRNADPCEVRCMEIQAWLAASAEPVRRFVVLDDTALDDLAPYLVRTDFLTGLGDEHVEQALALLSSETAL